jgi:hypothetical protein
VEIGKKLCLCDGSIKSGGARQVRISLLHILGSICGKFLPENMQSRYWEHNKKPRDGAKQAMITNVQRGASHRDRNGSEPR